MDLLEQLKNSDPDKQRAAIIEIAKLESLDPDRLKILYAELQKIIGKNDKSMNFFVRKATRNLEKIEKLNLGEAEQAKPSAEKRKAASGLREGLLSPDKTVRLNTLYAMTNSGLPKTEIIEILEKFAESAVEEEAIVAIELIGKCRGERPFIPASIKEKTPNGSQEAGEDKSVEEIEIVPEDMENKRMPLPGMRKKFPGKIFLFLILILGLIGSAYWKLSSPEALSCFLSGRSKTEVKPGPVLPGVDLLTNRAADFLKTLDGNNISGLGVKFGMSDAGKFQQDLADFIQVKFPRGWTVSLLLQAYAFEQKGLALFLMRESGRVTLLSQVWQVAGGSWIPAGIPNIVSVLPLNPSESTDKVEKMEIQAPGTIEIPGTDSVPDTVEPGSIIGDTLEKTGNTE